MTQTQSSGLGITRPASVSKGLRVLVGFQSVLIDSILLICWIPSRTRD